ncbi:hypothetical protein BACCAP_04194 [Pseudoflavonifractor capillosus ATCC 29799]|uniref:Uncharacterized protein n=1 Tax=Pseudoflavonifractor capillosus ATCC 29799 TaxID=411467 RepID=A6P126_9FIRM|nr:hypothetical protein BACCAP_04194 [Pseudoflavonifractor capillosus ATCC 29799]
MAFPEKTVIGTPPGYIFLRIHILFLYNITKSAGIQERKEKERRERKKRKAYSLPLF